MHMGSATDIETAAQDAVLREQEIVTQKIIHGQREARGESGLLEDVLYILSGRQDPNAIKEHLLKMTTDHRAEMALKRGKSNSPEGGNMKIGNRYGGPGGGAYYGASRPNFLTSSSKITFVGWYLGMIKSRPILTKSITSALIYTAADLSSQTLSKSNSEAYDLVRTLRMAVYGMVILGPSLHFWFNFVSKAFPNRDLISTLKKMIMGQAIYGPFMTSVFFSINATLRGETGSEIIARLKRDVVRTMLNGVMYWPLCDFITFRFVPVHLQPLTTNSFAFVWNVYMTYMASLEKVSTAS